MADKKISALTDGTTPATTDLFPAARSGGTTVQMAWSELKAAMPGAEVGYDQTSTNASISSTTEASGSTVISGTAHVFDGGPVLVQFQGITYMGAGTAIAMTVSLFESSTQITRLAQNQTPSSATFGEYNASGWYRFTPTAGSHTYNVTAFISGASAGAVVVAGGGGTGGNPPAFIRYTKV